MNAFKVKKPGVLSLVQDGGRLGRHRIGLTAGGPLDGLAMSWANRLVHNEAGATAIESSFGGLELEVARDTLLAVTGGDSELRINGEPRERWCSHRVRGGDVVSLGHARRFCRSYLAVAGGFRIAPQFGSTATVVREGIGGLNGDKLRTGDLLPVAGAADLEELRLTEPPRYSEPVELRVVPGYQWDRFPHLQRRRFFSGEYRVTDRADRMGYRLEGPAIDCDVEGILSEGICQGAIQIPADGQPIVLLQDRQTIGGYPKIGSALSLDTARLAQSMPGASVRFREIAPHDAHNALQLAAARFSRTEPEPRRG